MLIQNFMFSVGKFIFILSAISEFSLVSVSFALGLVSGFITPAVCLFFFWFLSIGITFRWPFLSWAVVSFGGLSGEARLKKINVLQGVCFSKKLN